MITKPMLAVAAEDLASLAFPLFGTPKLDGIRCLKVNGKAVSRKFIAIPNHHIRNWIEANCPDGFDGEIICPGKTFNQTQSLVMTEDGEPEFRFVIFDFANDLKRPYYLRVKDYFEWAMENSSKLEFAEVLTPCKINNIEELREYEEQQLKDGFEGVMVRTPDSPYKCGRSTLRESYLLKIKRFEDSEAEVIGFEEQMENQNEKTTDELGHSKRSSHKANLVPADMLGTLLVRDLKTKIEFGIGTGFDHSERSEIWKNQYMYIGKVVTYQHQPSGMKEKPRFPSFKGFRDPKDMS